MQYSREVQEGSAVLMAVEFDRLCSSPHPEAYFTAPNSPRHEPSLTKLVCDSFGSKTSIHVRLRRRVGDGMWKSLKFEYWSFELINERAARSGFGSLLGNKRIQLGFGKSSRSNEPDLWGLVLNDRAPIPVDGNMHMRFRFAEQHAEFVADRELIQISFRLELEFQDFCKQYFSCIEKNGGDSCELLAWARNSTSMWAPEEFSSGETMAGHASSSTTLSRKVQRLVMGVHEHDFIVGSDSIYILKSSEGGVRVQSELARLTEYSDSQRAAILLHDENTMMLMRTSQVCTPFSTN